MMEILSGQSAWVGILILGLLVAAACVVARLRKRGSAGEDLPTDQLAGIFLDSEVNQ